MEMEVDLVRVNLFRVIAANHEGAREPDSLGRAADAADDDWDDD